MRRENTYEDYGYNEGPQGSVRDMLNERERRYLWNPSNMMPDKKAIGPRDWTPADQPTGTMDPASGTYWGLRTENLPAPPVQGFPPPDPSMMRGLPPPDPSMMRGLPPPDPNMMRGPPMQPPPATLRGMTQSNYQPINPMLNYFRQ